MSDGVCVLVHACVHVYVYAFVCVCVSVCLSVCMYACVSVCMHMCLHACLRAYLIQERRRFSFRHIMAVEKDCFKIWKKHQNCVKLCHLIVTFIIFYYKCLPQPNVFPLSFCPGKQHLIMLTVIIHITMLPVIIQSYQLSLSCHFNSHNSVTSNVVILSH